MPTVNTEHLFQRQYPDLGEFAIGAFLVAATPGEKPTVELTPEYAGDDWWRVAWTPDAPGNFSYLWPESAPGALDSLADVVEVEGLLASLLPAADADFVAQAKLQGIGTSLSDAQWSQAYTDALREYSVQRPRVALGTLEVTAGTESYSLPTVGVLAGHICLDVEPADWLVENWEPFSRLLPEYALWQPGEALIDFHQPSQLDLFRQQLDAYGRQFGGGFVQDREGGPVRIVPPPAADQTLAVLFTVPHGSCATVPDGDAHLLLKALKWKALDVLLEIHSTAALAGGGRVTVGPYTKDTGTMASVLTTVQKRRDSARSEFLAAAFTGVGARKG